jgi:hypothetical protein
MCLTYSQICLLRSLVRSWGNTTLHSLLPLLDRCTWSKNSDGLSARHAWVATCVIRNIWVLAVRSSTSSANIVIQRNLSNWAIRCWHRPPTPFNPKITSHWGTTRGKSILQLPHRNHFLCPRCQSYIRATRLSYIPFGHDYFAVAIVPGKMITDSC